MTVRLRCCEPVPHDLVHVDQAPKADTAQWIGHGPWLHACVSAVCGHAAPPNLGAALVRVRDWKPAAHEVEQVDQSPKLATTQSTGHACTLQVRASAECGHALPPFAGCVRLRLRDWKPAAHDVEHVDQAPKAATAQSIGHA